MVTFTRISLATLALDEFGEARHMVRVRVGEHHGFHLAIVGPKSVHHALERVGIA